MKQSKKVKDLKKASKKLDRALHNFMKDPEKFEDELDEAIDFADSVTSSSVFEKTEKFFKSIFD